MANLTAAVDPGPKFTVVWAVNASGEMPARDFFLSQSDGDRAKLLALFKRLADFGLINDREKFKKLGDKAGAQGKEL